MVRKTYLLKQATEKAAQTSEFTQKSNQNKTQKSFKIKITHAHYSSFFSSFYLTPQTSYFLAWDMLQVITPGGAFFDRKTVHQG